VVEGEVFPRAEVAEPLLLRGGDVFGGDEHPVAESQLIGRSVREGPADLLRVAALGEVAGEPLELEADDAFQPWPGPVAREAVNAPLRRAGLTLRLVSELLFAGAGEEELVQELLELVAAERGDFGEGREFGHGRGSLGPRGVWRRQEAVGMGLAGICPAGRCGATLAEARGGRRRQICAARSQFEHWRRARGPLLRPRNAS